MPFIAFQTATLFDAAIRMKAHEVGIDQIIEKPISFDIFKRLLVASNILRPDE